MGSAVRKHPSLKADYPALCRVWTPFDSELNFRAWYGGATNMICLCLCAERVCRLWRRCMELTYFENHGGEIEKTVASRVEDVKQGNPPQSPFLGLLRTRLRGILKVDVDDGDNDGDDAAVPAFKLDDKTPAEGALEAGMGQAHKLESGVVAAGDLPAEHVEACDARSDAPKPKAGQQSAPDTRLLQTREVKLEPDATDNNLNTVQETLTPVVRDEVSWNQERRDRVCA